jgi:putative DNA-invertase from lambdoid prophage Rac
VLEIRGIGPVGSGAGELVLAVLAQVADMERRRILERCEAGRAAARNSLAATGKTHRGKRSLGRPPAADRAQVVSWRASTKSSLQATAERFGISEISVKRRAIGEQAELTTPPPVAL